MSLRAATVRGLARSPSAGVFFSRRVVKYGSVNGTSGDYFSTPDTAAYDSLTALQITVDFRLNALGTNAVFCAKQTGSEYSFYFLKDSNNDLSLVISTDGSAGGRVTVTRIPTVALVANARTVARATWRASDGRVQLFSGSSVAGLAQAGANGTVAVANLFNSSSIIEVGSRSAGTANPFSGKIYSCEISGTIGGAAITSFNPAFYGSGTTFTAQTGEVWTLNGGAKILAQEL